MFHRIIFLFLIVSSLSCNFNRLSVQFVFLVHELDRLQPCRSTQKCRAYQTLYKITHRYNRRHVVCRDSVGVESSGSGLKIRVRGYFPSEFSLIVAPY